MQFDRAANYLKRSREAYGDKDDNKKKQIDQILGAWGQFEPLYDSASRLQRNRRLPLPQRQAGSPLRVHEILFTKLLKDVKDWHLVQAQAARLAKAGISATSAPRLVVLNQEQYIGRSVARWDLDVEPRPAHFDRRITVTTPLQKAGAYLLTAHMEGANISRIVVWLDDTVILKNAFTARPTTSWPTHELASPSPVPASISSDGTLCRNRARTNTESRPGRSHGNPTATADCRYRPQI